MCKLSGEYPYGCKEYKKGDLEQCRHHITKTICLFKSSDIDNNKNLIFADIKDKFNGKHIWTLFGSNDEKNWICLQVASKKNEDVVKEIISDIVCMLLDKSITGRVWSSKFHKEVFQPNYDFSDLRHQKYQLIRNSFSHLMFIALNENILEDSDIVTEQECEKYQYVEVKYACITKPLFWNAFGKEHNIVEQFL